MNIFFIHSIIETQVTERTVSTSIIVMIASIIIATIAFVCSYLFSIRNNRDKKDTIRLFIYIWIIGVFLITLIGAIYSDLSVKDTYNVTGDVKYVAVDNDKNSDNKRIIFEGDNIEKLELNMEGQLREDRVKGHNITFLNCSKDDNNFYICSDLISNDTYENEEKTLLDNNIE